MKKYFRHILCLLAASVFADPAGTDSPAVVYAGQRLRVL
nr:hypothetical protein DWUX_135 [Desulfovibrio diazotrophicus]